MVYALLVVLVILLICSIYANFNMMRKIEDASDKFNISERSREELELWITSLSTSLSSIISRVKEVDRKGSFESDDEIGFFFKEIKKLSEELNEFVE